MGTMAIFVALATDFIVRVITRKPWTVRLRKQPEVFTPTEEGTTTIGSSPPNRAEKTSPLATSHQFDTSLHLRKAEYLLAGVAFASLMIFVRGVYRSIELAQGWTGHLITHEPFFTWLDGLPMVLCYFSFAVAHPGFLLPSRVSWKRAGV